MSTTVARINTIVTANTKQFTLQMAKAQLQAGNFKKAAMTAAKAASGPLALGLLAAGGAAVGAATKFEDSMSKIESLVGVAGDEVDAMKSSVLDLAGSTAQAPAKLADAMFFIQSAGLRGATAMETLEASAKASAVGLGDVTQVADLATSALNAYGAENLSATQATDVLTAAVREGKLEASELSGAIGQTLPVASAMGVRFDEVGAAFAAMSRTGTGASEAATQLRGILSTLLKPAKEAEDTLNEMGMSSQGLREQIREKGLLSVLETLVGAFDGNAAATASVFGNVRALTGVLDLMGSGAESTRQIFANMTDTTGVLEEAFGVTAETAGFKFRQAFADLQEQLVKFGQTILPTVLTMLEGVKSLIGFFMDLPDPIKAAAGAMAAFVIASGPIGQVAVAVGAILFAFGKMGEQSRRAEARQKDLTAEFVAAKDPAQTLSDRLTDLAASIEDVADEADDAVKPVNELVGSNLALAMALDNETLPMFDQLGISMDDVASAAENGTDAFQDLQGMGTRTGIAVSDLDSRFGDLNSSGKEVAERLMDAFNAGKITRSEFTDMLDVIDELADAFDDNRKVVEASNKEFIKSEAAVKLLEAAGLDAESVLADLTSAGLSFTEQARIVDELTRSVAYAMEEAEGPIADVDEATLDVASAMEEAADGTRTFEDAFRDLMDAILGPGDALNDAQLLVEDVNEVIADLAEKSLPEARDEFSKFAGESAASLGALVDQGMELGGPELVFHANVFLEKLGEINEAAQRPVEELVEVLRIFEEISGTTLSLPVRLDFLAPGFGEGFTGADLRAQIEGLDFGAFASGGIVTRPTLALIGEAGPEAVVPLSGGRGGPAMGGLGSMSVTVNMPTGSDGADVVRALQRYARAHGGTVPIVTGQL